jgi:hypothetical protein
MGLAAMSAGVALVIERAGEAQLGKGASDVLRSRWPNIPEADLVELAGRWAAARCVRVHLVFDGRASGELVGERDVEPSLRLVGTGAQSADDAIVRIAKAVAGRRAAVSPRHLRPGASPAGGRGRSGNRRRELRG